MDAYLEGGLYDLLTYCTQNPDAQTSIQKCKE